MRERRLALTKVDVALWPFLIGCLVGLALIELAVVIALTVSLYWAGMTVLFELAAIIISAAFLDQFDIDE